MSEVRQAYDDEIDLFDFFEALWDGKWLIAAFVSLATVVGFSYSKVGQPKYEVSVPLKVELYSVSSQQICGPNIKCMKNEARNSVISLLGEGWEEDGPELSLTTRNPLDVNKYEEKLVHLNDLLTAGAYDEAQNELALIQTELDDAFLSTEVVATNMLNAKRIIRLVDGGQKIISFGSISIEPSPKFSLIITLSALFGGMFGVTFVLVRNAVRKRKQQLSEAWERGSKSSAL
ncbi:Wzz/FepE/Etk N-terminal domain-containing protein [Thalassospira indica]|uniref:Polysaccharide chain length determinant N-terminal domain-containing protein n=1 Tax=Thalassospira indica TaxID=1891279 RepID=A0ABM6XXV1_9PROT|nr:Wzz/FepE/Etk N-terminal domain-containing protein [Thalassospira indica]AXO14269.1 hypothetical protein DY252_08555 [Thalassospira indica]OAZ09211.1 hypothetical protein TH15_20300 [Thalassospira profundimaris]